VLPPPLRQAIEKALSAAGDTTGIRSDSYVGGGDINEAARVTTGDGSYFVKWNQHPPPDLFSADAKGLKLLAANGLVRTPKVIGQGGTGDTKFLILEWLDTTGKSSTAAEQLGRSLAKLHRIRQPYYGLDHDNHCGRTPQINTQAESWIEFYGDRRLRFQRDLAERHGLLPPVRVRMLDNLIEHLDRWIDESACQPSLLHGDLWGGNWVALGSGEPALIDPAVYYGDREADLAMTSLFGGFPSSSYDAYQEEWPLPDGWQQREPLYQLYHLLNHLNLFGEGYGGSVDSILRRYQ
jgi:fructosamine-3-kinase